MNISSLVLRHSGRLSSAAIKLREGVQSLGRAPACDIVISHRSVSRLHAQLSVIGTTAIVHDLNSRNGTYVNEERIKSAPLPEGAHLRFGSVALVVTAIGAAAHPKEVEEETRSLSNVLEALPIEIALLKLSPAERRVFNHLVRGRPEKVVARRLNISRHTVHNHVRRIYRKLGVRSRAELLARFVTGANASQLSSVRQSSKRQA
jgi:DNA-binding CsgD family transcriptional regulator